MTCPEKWPLSPTWACSRTSHTTTPSTSSCESMWSGYVVLKSTLSLFLIGHLKQMCGFFVAQATELHPADINGRPTHISPSSSGTQRSSDKENYISKQLNPCLESQYINTSILLFSFITRLILTSKFNLAGLLILKRRSRWIPPSPCPSTTGIWWNRWTWSGRQRLTWRTVSTANTGQTCGLSAGYAMCVITSFKHLTWH